MRSVFVVALLAPTGCFDSAAGTRGLPCTEDSACGSLACDYGVCGGPVRCEAGAGVGEYCFALASEVQLGAGIDALAIGTIDFDPLPDLVVGNGAAQTITLLRNAGPDGFAAPVVSPPLGVTLGELALGAIDGAGWTDVAATADGTTLVTVPILPGSSGGGEIGAAQVISSSLVGAARPQVGRFVDDADALPDVAVLVANGFDVFPQPVASTFGAPKHTEVAGSADLKTISSDASLVFVASSSGNSVVAHTRVAGGAFTAIATIDVGPAPRSFVLDDLDNDTFADVLAVGEGGKMWLTTGRDATFAMPREPIEVYDLGWTPHTLIARNLDDDPEPELIVAGGREDGRRDVYLFDNDGQGRPIYGGSLDIDDAAAVAVADLDLDGVSEIVIASADRGSIRVARRAVAPAPPGGQESTGETTGPDDPSVSDPTFTTDPTLPTDPSSMTMDPSVTGDTGVEPSCPDDQTLLGFSCYSLLGEFVTESPVVAMEIGAVALTSPQSLVVATADTRVLNYTGGFGVFADASGTLFNAGDVPTDLAIGEIEIARGQNLATVVVTHAAGFTTFVDAVELANADQWIGGSSAPVIGRIVQRVGMPPTTGIAVGSGLSLHALTAEALLAGESTAQVATPNDVIDIDVVPSVELGAAMMVGSGGPLDVFGITATTGPYSLAEGLIDGNIDYSQLLFGPELTGMLVTAGADGLVVYDVGGAGDPVATFSDPIEVVADFRVGEFDYAPGQDLVVMHEVDGIRFLRFYGSLEGGQLYWMGELPVAGATAFTTYSFLAAPSDLIVAFEIDGGQGYLWHIGAISG